MRKLRWILLAVVVAGLGLGSVGPVGADLPKIRIIKKSDTLPGGGGQVDSKTANCPTGFAAVAGGYETEPEGSFTIRVNGPMINGQSPRDLPDGATTANPSGWRVTLFNTSSSEVDYAVMAVCARLP